MRVPQDLWELAKAFNAMVMILALLMLIMYPVFLFGENVGSSECIMKRHTGELP